MNISEILDQLLYSERSERMDNCEKRQQYQFLVENTKLRLI
jgi:hypothetical protein